MKMIFENNGTELYVHIRCTTAVDEHKINSKLYTHSEYTTEYDEKVEEWRENKLFDDYFIHCKTLGEQVTFRFIVFTKYKPELIKELNKYFNEYETGYYEVTYNNNLKT